MSLQEPTGITVNRSSSATVEHLAAFGSGCGLTPNACLTSAGGWRSGRRRPRTGLTGTLTNGLSLTGYRVLAKEALRLARYGALSVRR